MPRPSQSTVQKVCKACQAPHLSCGVDFVSIVLVGRVGTERGDGSRHTARNEQRRHPAQHNLRHSSIGALFSVWHTRGGLRCKRTNETADYLAGRYPQCSSIAMRIGPRPIVPLLPVENHSLLTTSIVATSQGMLRAAHPGTRIVCTGTQTGACSTCTRLQGE